MNEMLRPIMTASYVLGLLVTLGGATVKLATVAGLSPAFEAANWGIGACALFLCALASAGMIETRRR